MDTCKTQNTQLFNFVIKKKKLHVKFFSYHSKLGKIQNMNKNTFKI